jgi:hypothetical protein
VWRIATNASFWRFFLGNVSLSLTEVYKDVDRARFFAEMERLTPGAITPDMVEDSFTGVMAQVRTNPSSSSSVCPETDSFTGVMAQVRTNPFLLLLCLP